MDKRGAVVREVPLPAQVAAGATSNAFEGVTTVGRGDDAQIKKVTRVELAGVTPVPAGTPRPVLVKQTVLGLIPALRAGGGVADKPEGLAITG